MTPPRERHVLLVATAFPPGGQVGARRALRFARGLSAHGFRISVLTLEERYLGRVDPDSPGLSDTHYRVVRTATWAPGRRARPPRQAQPDPADLGPPPSAAKRFVSRLRGAAGRFLLHSLLVPDEHILWLPAALRAAREIHAREPLDLVLATLPPNSQLLLAGRIASRTGAGLVVDYRDPWSADRSLQHNAARRRLEQALEHRTLRRSRLAIFNTPSALRFYQNEVPDLPRSEVLPNGIDQFVEATAEIPGAPLTWMYAGSLYGGSRSLAPLLRVMARLRDEIELRLVLIGSDFEAERGGAEELGVADRIELLGRKPFRETMRRLRSGHRLVAVVSADHPLSTPAKIFDYLSTSRPMLILADPQHAVNELLRDIPEHSVIDPAREDQLAALLRRDHGALTAGGIPDVPRASSKAFEAERQMEVLARWLHEL